MRLDSYLKQLYPSFSRSYIAKSITNKPFKVNQKVAKVSQILHKRDIVSFDSKTFITKKPKEIKLPIVYEDKNVIVIDKPCGIITHSNGAHNDEGSVASFIKPYLNGPMQGDRAGIVHRLDRGTSGIIIAAKNPETLQFLQRQFSSRKVKKTYLAVVQGTLENDQAIINMPIERNPKVPAIFRVGANGKSAITNYRVVSTNGNYTLIELRPETGRTHQIRVHLKAIGHPIVGDNIYGGATNSRLMLHATSLELTMPDNGKQIFNSKPAEIFYELVKN